MSVTETVLFTVTALFINGERMRKVAVTSVPRDRVSDVLGLLESAGAICALVETQESTTTEHDDTGDVVRFARNVH